MRALFWKGYRGALDEVTSHAAGQPTLASGTVGDTVRTHLQRPRTVNVGQEQVTSSLEPSLVSIMVPIYTTYDNKKKLHISPLFQPILTTGNDNLIRISEANDSQHLKTDKCMV
jgi:hypothetical protein